MARAALSAALTCDLDPAPGGRRPRGRGQSAAHTDVLDARCGFPGSLTLGPPALPPLGATPCHAHGPRKHRAARVCHTPRGAEGGLRRCGQRRCAPSPRPAARLCVRRLACWFQLLESSAFVVAGDYERGGLAAHTCPPLRGSAAQGLAAIHTTSGPWMASGAPSATTVPPTSVPRLGSAPPVRRPWRLRRRGRPGGLPSPRGLPLLHEGSGHGQPEQRRREGRPAPAVPMAVLFRRDGLQPVAGHLSAHELRATTAHGRATRDSASAQSRRAPRACIVFLSLR